MSTENHVLKMKEDRIRYARWAADLSQREHEARNRFHVVKEYPYASSKCIHWLSGEMPRGHSDGLCDDENDPWGHYGDWFDHGKFWLCEDGTRMAVGQPYGLSDRAITQLSQLMGRGFTVVVEDSWYYPSKCVAVRVFIDKNQEGV